MIGQIQNPQAAMLCRLAQDDESTLQFRLPDLILGFHAQQSCEKLMKALLTVHGVGYPYTHELTHLERLLANKSETMPSLPFSLRSLEPFGVEFRYNLGEPLLEAEREAIAQTTVLVRQHILTRILEIEDANPPASGSELS